ncbi:MAG: hypothetical protein E7265_08340 [Lachnospiraceae bacterium]|nr:hypothetical protein [Lachnospiraceae bacterium]
MRAYLTELIRGALNGVKPDSPPEGLDWNELYNLADYHGVAGTVYYGIEKLYEAEQPPSEVFDRFRKASYISLGRESMQFIELNNVFSAFDENNIKYILLKGLKMKNLYPRPDMRSMCDGDILVLPEDMDRIQEVMKECGFVIECKGNVHDTYMKNNNLSVEIHKQLFSDNSPYFDYFKSFFDRGKAVFGKCEYELSKEDFYIHMIAHMAKHFKKGGTGVRSFMDVYEYYEKYGSNLNEDYLNDELEKLGLKGFAQASKELAYSWFGENSRAKNGSKVAHPKMAIHVLMAGTYGCIGNVVATGIVEKNIGRGEYVRRRLFPGVEFMKINYPILDKVPVLLPICWIIRVIKVFCFGNKRLLSEAKSVGRFGEANKEWLDEVWRDSGF